MSTTWFGADFHFAHRRILYHAMRKPWLKDNPNYNESLEYHIEKNNPYIGNIQQFNDDMKKIWNGLVSKKDDVYINGDFAWSDHNHFIAALNGKKHLIIGSHDDMSQDCYRNFSSVHDARTIVKCDGVEIVLDHHALRSWPKSFHNTLHLYAHSHSRMPEYMASLSFDVGIDAWPYVLVPWEVVREKMSIKFEYKKQLDGMRKHHSEDCAITGGKMFADNEEDLKIKNMEIWNRVCGKV